MRVEIQDNPGEEWDSFVQSVPGACLGHESRWAQIFRRTYGVETHYLTASEGEEIRGVLPLAFLPRPWGPRRLLSLPYLDTAGVLARDADAERALLDSAVTFAQARSAGPVEIRNPHALLDGRAMPAQSRVNLVLDLEETVEAQWTGLRAKVRNQTRKAEKEGLRIRKADRPDLLEAFYSAFCVNMRDLGSPVHSRDLFEEIDAAFGTRVRIIVVESDAGPVGGLVAIRSGETVYVPWASTLRSERKKCPNNMIYWEALRWAVETGATRFDFGRSEPEGGTYRFKKGWGAEEEPLAWMVLGANGEILPPKAASDGQTMHRVAEAWSRLPVGLTRVLGPRIRRYFGN